MLKFISCTVLQCPQSKAKTQCVKHCETEEYQNREDWECQVGEYEKGVQQTFVIHSKCGVWLQVMECRATIKKCCRINLWSWWTNFV